MGLLNRLVDLSTGEGHASTTLLSLLLPRFILKYDYLYQAKPALLSKYCTCTYQFHVKHSHIQQQGFWVTDFLLLVSILSFELIQCPKKEKIVVFYV